MNVYLIWAYGAAYGLLFNHAIFPFHHFHFITDDNIIKTFCSYHLTGNLICDYREEEKYESILVYEYA